jgi:peptidoglycan/xylan/chitin deacetylase (PgdA/CDA1 family)
LASLGIEIGSHTLDHTQLTKASDQDMARQLIASKRSLEAMTGQPVVSIAYPFGSYDDEIVRNTTKAGYLYAVTTLGGLADLAQPMELMRYRAKDTPTLDFDNEDTITYQKKY